MNYIELINNRKFLGIGLLSLAKTRPLLVSDQQWQDQRLDKISSFTNNDLYNVRISSTQHHFIKKYWQEQFPNAKVYLFGSRADDAKRGGDIDLMVLNDKKIGVNDKIKFLSSFMTDYGEQKIDLVTYTFDEDIPFKRIALDSAIEL